MAYSFPPDSIARDWYWEISGLVQRVNAAHRECPFYVSSWWRSFDDNVGADGHPYSQHLIATAADLVPQEPYTKSDLVTALRRQGLFTTHPRTYPRHVHTQLLPAGWLQRYAFA